MAGFSCAQARRKPTPSRPTRTCSSRIDATIDTKPQLEIYADDVKCTHGATIGQLDEESIFYLRARGIGLETARHMLIHAFAGEIIDRIRLSRSGGVGQAGLGPAGANERSPYD